MGKLIIDSHVHLWDQLTGYIENRKIISLGGGRTTFIDEDRQMMPPYMIDGRNSVEMFIANMQYAQVSGAVITQEYIDGNQNTYLLDIKKNYPTKFKVCGLFDHRLGSWREQMEQMVTEGFDGVKIVAQRMVEDKRKTYLNSPMLIDALKVLEAAGGFLSIDLDEGEGQVAELSEVIKECPNLRIAIGHFGMVNRNGWHEQIKLARAKNVVIESGGITWLFHKEFYPYHGACEAIKEAIALIGEDKVLWGSDYPRTMTAITYKMSWDFIEKSTLLSDAHKRKLLGENARQFYGFESIEEPRFIKNMVED